MTASGQAPAPPHYADDYPILAPGERTPEQVPVLAPMSLGAVWVLVAVVAVALGILLAWLGGVL